MVSTSHKPNFIEDPVVREAVGGFATRSERAEDLERLVATFVDSGILGLVDNSKNQVIYGRRGTGKTHLLRVIEARFGADETTVVTYLDARTLGSSELFTDTDRPLHLRFLGLYRDVIAVLHNALFYALASGQRGNVDAALSTLAEIERQLLYKESDAESVRAREAETASQHTGGEFGASLSATNLALTGTASDSQSRVVEAAVERTSAQTAKVIFPALHAAFTKLMGDMELSRFVILIDEWSSVPLDLQPYLAELLNRVFFANPRITVKIASLEFRSRFSTVSPEGVKQFGLELGGDLETAVDLDDFYVYDRDPAGTEKLFADLLFRHISANISNEGYLDAQFGISGPADFRQIVFTEQAFKELVRAAEGVARDLLQIFLKAYTRAWKTAAAHVTVPTVTAAAQDWYESDKQSNLSDSQHRLLRQLVEQVIGTRRARSFLVAREDSSSPLLRSLIDQRVVHVIRKGYADKDNPGIRYNIYTLDYGCYVDLKGTLGAPQFELALNLSEEDGAPVVPFDDNRSIRRIVLPRDLLFPSLASP